MTYAATGGGSVSADWMGAVSTMATQSGRDDWMAGGSFPDLLTDLKRQGHISDDLYIAGCRLVHDMTRFHGSSAGIVAQYGERTAKGDGSSERRNVSDFDAFRRMDAILSAMRDHERKMLAFCVLSRELERGSLADWGRQQSSFKTRQQAKAVAVGQVKTLLQTISELYRQKIPITA